MKSEIKMTRKGAECLIEMLSLRVFEIQDARARLDAEEQRLKGRIRELEMVRDRIEPTRIISVGK